ncbi:hypothetical protein SEA_JUSTBECAUSE_38 [Streptomyces phage JustBecause]|nr:hypothetical protein SEA_JUSTBECAUSE_38 [Streptomyces phage JustBecause]
MRQYARGYLAFCVKVGSHFKELLEEKGALREYNAETGADLGYLEAGSYGNQELFITTYCESAEPLEPKPVDVADFTEERMAVWRGQIQRFLRQAEIPPVNAIGFRIIADLDN